MKILKEYGEKVGTPKYKVIQEKNKETHKSR